MPDRIIRILCIRDAMSVEDARALVKQTVDEIDANLGDTEAIEDIMMNNLGLEMDYIFDLLS